VFTGIWQGQISDCGRITGNTEVVADGLCAAGVPEIPDREAAFTRLTVSQPTRFADDCRQCDSSNLNDGCKWITSE
jgi:hypothetical protein